MKRARSFVAAAFATAALLSSVDAWAEGKGGEGKGAKAPFSFASKPAPGTKARCPVARETFTIKETTLCSEHGGRHYCFCCAECKPDFDKDPSKFTAKK